VTRLFSIDRTKTYTLWKAFVGVWPQRKSSATADGLRDAPCQSKSC